MATVEEAELAAAARARSTQYVRYPDRWDDVKQRRQQPRLGVIVFERSNPLLLLVS
jgi:hypothetical protein